MIVYIWIAKLYIYICYFVFGGVLFYVMVNLKDIFDNWKLCNIEN